MRGYIWTINKQGNYLAYSFTSTSTNASHWRSLEAAETSLSMMTPISVTSASKCDTTYCTDFDIEKRPEGGFMISCEVPFSLRV